MEFGKLEDISGVDFSLPPDPARNAFILERSHQEEALLNLYIGGTGWSMKEWVGKVYPAGTKAKDYLRQYSLQFNTIELNTTHYRIPDTATVKRWHAEAAADFRFCPKVPQSISHSRDLGLGSGQITAFCEAVQGLEEKLGCCFIQLPPYFDFDRMALLEHFVDRWPAGIPLAVELRHESWFDRPERQEAVFNMLADHHISSVITDVAGRRDVLHMQLTTPLTMIRFVGNGLDPTDYSRIDEWVGRLLSWHQQGLTSVFFFTHEPDNILAPELARYLYDRFHPLEFTRGRGPRLDSSGRQISLF